MRKQSHRLSRKAHVDRPTCRCEKKERLQINPFDRFHLSFLMLVCRVYTCSAPQKGANSTVLERSKETGAPYWLVKRSLAIARENHQGDVDRREIQRVSKSLVTISAPLSMGFETLLNLHTSVLTECFRSGGKMKNVYR